MTGKLVLGKKQSDELRHLQSLLHRIRQSKASRKTWTGHVALRGGRYTELCWRNAGKGCLEDLDIDGRIILKWFEKEKAAWKT